MADKFSSLRTPPIERSQSNRFLVRPVEDGNVAAEVCVCVYIRITVKRCRRKSGNYLHATQDLSSCKRRVRNSSTALVRR